MMFKIRVAAWAASVDSPSLGDAFRMRLEDDRGLREQSDPLLYADLFAPMEREESLARRLQRQSPQRRVHR